MTIVGASFGWRAVAVALATAPASSSAAQPDQPPAGSLRLDIQEVWTSERFDMAGGLSIVTGLAETADGALWISDLILGGSGRVLAHRGATPPGLTRVVARTGDGPGEVLSPGRIAVAPNGDVAVFDQSRGGVEMYSPEGEPRGRVRFPVQLQWPKGFDVLASGGFVLSGPIPGVDFAVHYFGPSGDLRRSWGATATADDFQAQMIGTGGAVHALSDGLFLYSQGAPHLIVRYDAEADEAGADGQQVVALPGFLEAPGDAVIVETVEDGVPQRSFNVTYPQSVAVFEVAGGLVLNVVQSWDEGTTTWQLFDPSRPTDDGAALVAETEVGVVYVSPFSMSPSGDILATRLDPVTEDWVVVRLRATWDR